MLDGKWIVYGSDQLKNNEFSELNELFLGSQAHEMLVFCQKKFKYALNTSGWLPLKIVNLRGYA